MGGQLGRIILPAKLNSIELLKIDHEIKNASHHLVAYPYEYDVSAFSLHVCVLHLYFLQPAERP